VSYETSDLGDDVLARLKSTGQGKEAGRESVTTVPGATGPESAAGAHSVGYPCAHVPAGIVERAHRPWPLLRPPSLPSLLSCGIVTGMTRSALRPWRP